MSGPEHYTEAERLLALAPALDPVAEAQVHATLALVAALVETRQVGPVEGWGGHDVSVENVYAWREAAG